MAELPPRSRSGPLLSRPLGPGPGSLVHGRGGHVGPALGPLVTCRKPAGRRCDKMTRGRMTNQEWRAGRLGASRVAPHDGDPWRALCPPPLRPSVTAGPDAGVWICSMTKVGPGVELRDC